MAPTLRDAGNGANIGSHHRFVMRRDVLSFALVDMATVPSDVGECGPQSPAHGREPLIIKGIEHPPAQTHDMESLGLRGCRTGRKPGTCFIQA